MVSQKMLFEHNIFSKPKDKINSKQLSEMPDTIIPVLVIQVNKKHNCFSFWRKIIKTPSKNERQLYKVDGYRESKKTCLKLINENYLYLGKKINGLEDIPFLDCALSKNGTGVIKTTFSEEEYLKSIESLIVKSKLKAF